MFGILAATVSHASKAKGLRPYKLQVCQRLTDDNKVRRLSFCHPEIGRIGADAGHLQLLVFSDEAAFHLDRHVNCQCTHFWSKTNPHFVTTGAVNSPGVTVRCGLWREGGIGQFLSTALSQPILTSTSSKIFFARACVKYHMLKEVCILQQDGATAHFTAKVRCWLDAHFLVDGARFGLDALAFVLLQPHTLRLFCVGICEVPSVLQRPSGKSQDLAKTPTILSNVLGQSQELQSVAREPGSL